MKATTFLPIRLTLYALLSCADLALTYMLIRTGEGEVYESNPIAEAWLNSYGWTGLALYKLGIVLIVATLAAFISLSRPRTGGHVLSFACLSVALVVGYSVHLSFSPALRPTFTAPPIASADLKAPQHGSGGMVLGMASVKFAMESAVMQPQRSRP